MHIYEFVGTADYFFLGAAGLWGLYCIFLVAQRVSMLRFKSEEAQNGFMENVENFLSAGDFESAKNLCGEDRRALPRMMDLAIRCEDMPSDEMELLVMDTFQADVVSDFDASLNWVSTIIKAAPMLGLIGTVAGMMGAFATLEEATAADPTKQLLADIRMALEHTMIGLLITTTLLIIVAFVNNRIKRLEESVVFGMNRFFRTLSDANRHFRTRRSA